MIRSLGKLNTTTKVTHGSPQLTSGQHVVNITSNYPTTEVALHGWGGGTREREREGEKKRDVHGLESPAARTQDLHYPPMWYMHGYSCLWRCTQNDRRTHHEHHH